MYYQFVADVDVRCPMFRCSGHSRYVGLAVVYKVDSSVVYLLLPLLRLLSQVRSLFCETERKNAHTLSGLLKEGSGIDIDGVAWDGSESKDMADERERIMSSLSEAARGTGSDGGQQEISVC